MAHAVGLMDHSGIPVKTERGRLALRDRDFAGPRALRALLIMMDGQHSADQLVPAMASLGLSWRDVQQLADSGLMVWTADRSAGPGGVDFEL